MENLGKPYGYLRTEQGLILRHGHWPYPGGSPQGTVLLLQGRSEYMEKYEETIGELLHRRMDVFSFDWRGQGMSDRMLADSQKGFVRHYDDYLEDLDLILDTIVRPGLRGPLYMLSHSMGGHLGLRYMYRGAHPFAKAVFSAPMIAVSTRPFPAFFVRWMARWQVAEGCSDQVVFGSARRTPFPDRFRGNRWTSDRDRFDRNRKMIKDRPELSAAHVTYGWLAATYDSTDILMKPGSHRVLKTPLLFVRAGQDRIVSNKATRQFVSAAANCRLVTIENARHEILQEGDSQRRLFWRAFDEIVGAE